MPSCRFMWSSPSTGVCPTPRTGSGPSRRNVCRNCGTALGRLGAPLVVRIGDAVAVLEALRRAHGVTAIVSHEETGNLWTFARDRRVADWARQAGVAWDGAAALRRRPAAEGPRRLGRRRATASSSPTRYPRRRPCVRLRRSTSVRSPRPPNLALLPTAARRARPAVGARASGCSRSFLTERGHDYRAAMSTPLAGEHACSRLSPHLALGTLSVREAAQAAAARQRAVRGTRDGWGGSLRSFQARLAWRDHFIQKLEDEPAIEVRCLHPDYEGLRPRDPDAAAPCGVGSGRDRAALRRRLHALSARDGLAQLPHAVDADGGGLLSPLARLAGDGAASGAALHRLRARHPLAARCRCSRGRRA